MTPSLSSLTPMRRTAIAIVAALSACFLALSIGAGAASAAPGQLDPKFSGDGYADLSTGSHADLLYSGHRRVEVATVDKGKPDLLGQLVLEGIDAHGNLDPQFGTNGIVTWDLPVFALNAQGAVDPQGRLLIAVATAGPSYLLRYSHDGKLDSSFGNGGVVQLRNQNLDDVAVGPGGTIVTVGHTYYGVQPQAGTYGPVFDRWTPNGAPDTSFGNGGELRITTGGCNGTACMARNWYINGLGIEPNGALVATADIQNYGPAAPLQGGVVLVSANGSTYKLKTNLIPGASTVGEDVEGTTIQPDGRILVAYNRHDYSTGQNVGAGVARFMPDGTLDSSFGSGGVRYVGAGIDDTVYDVKLDSRGRILLGGSAGDQATGVNSTLVSRLLPSGTIDKSFGGGAVRTPFDVASADLVPAGGPVSLIVDARRRPILATQVVSRNGSHIELTRYLAGK